MVPYLRSKIKGKSRFIYRAFHFISNMFYTAIVAWWLSLPHDIHIRQKLAVCNDGGRS